MRSPEEYAAQLWALMPQGLAWKRRLESFIGRVLSGGGEELARVDQRGYVLVDEADPNTTMELLTDWERMLGLPDPCRTLSPTVEQRRWDVIMKLRRPVGQSRDFFIQIAIDLGSPDASIDEFFPFTTMSLAGDNLFDDEWRFVWRLNAQDAHELYFTPQSVAGERLVTWGDPVLECVINRLKPAHTQVLIGYSGGTETMEEA